MRSLDQLALGAPGIYEIPDEPVRALTGIRMDIAAFVGVAPRGPARQPVFAASWAPKPCGEDATVVPTAPVAVESWDHYRRLYGDFEGPGRLPYAVAAFFENGGQRAYIVRIVHDYRLPEGSPDAERNAAGMSRAPLPGVIRSGMARPAWLRARNEGRWGDGLSAVLSVRTRPLTLPPGAISANGLYVQRGIDIPAGALLRLQFGSVRHLARVVFVREEWRDATSRRESFAVFGAAAPGIADGIELVEGILDIDDGAGRTEHLEGLGLSALHPRWLAKVLVTESELLYPGDDPDPLLSDVERSWIGDDLDLDPALAACRSDPFAGGLDRYRDITPNDFFDAEWVLGDDCPGRGVHALVDLADLSLIVTPDLYSPGPLTPMQPILDLGGAGPEFGECVDLPRGEQSAPLEDLDGLRLDPRLDLARIIELHQRLIDLATQIAGFIVLLDVPPGLSQRQIQHWRSQCHSAFAAAYHPWLLVSRPDDRRDALLSINPSAAAAGIIAASEIALGVQNGPANALAVGTADVAERVAPVQHAALHQTAINVFLRDVDGVRLTAARTLSPDPSYRQLNVRRLVTMLERLLYREMQWTVFEPNNVRLRGDVRHQIEAYLRQLFLANAFAGARESDAFFVRCDEGLNPPAFIDQGRFLAEIGVAPAEPLEFIVLQLARGGDGTLRVAG